MQESIQIGTSSQNGLYDITLKVKEAVSRSGVKNGMLSVCVQGATATIMILFI